MLGGGELPSGGARCRPQYRLLPVVCARAGPPAGARDQPPAAAPRAPGTARTACVNKPQVNPK
eukprot:6589172-Pyramimonas_sp.AAC.1